MTCAYAWNAGISPATIHNDAVGSGNRDRTVLSAVVIAVSAFLGVRQLREL
jgi:hypothetical protein